jgi:uncharacterized membrane protein
MTYPPKGCAPLQGPLLLCAKSVPNPDPAQSGGVGLARHPVFGDVAAMSDRAPHPAHKPHRATPERAVAFSDGVFAVLITVLVLELRPPELPTFRSLLALWPTWLSYATSYLFIAIVWTNHHYVMRFAREGTPRLLWFNFAHLFSISLLPISTAWMAVSRLAPQPVAFYAAVLFLVNITYIGLVWELSPAEDASPAARKVVRLRSIMTLACFTIAIPLALLWPLAGLGLCLVCMFIYLWPDPRMRKNA